MTTVDEQIQLAGEVAQKIVEHLRRAERGKRGVERLLKSSRNEWMRWMQIAEKYGMDKGITYAQHLSQDITMRPNIQKINKAFKAAVSAYQKRLRALSPAQRRQVLGYVAWYLRISGEN